MPPIQELAVGRSASEAWCQGIGQTQQNFDVPPQRAIGMVVGMPDCGKTRFFCGVPNCLILNTDALSMPTREAADMKAAVWPALSPAGEAIDPGTGQPLTLGWAAIEGLVAELERRVANNLPRPSMIVGDSISSILGHAMDEVTKRGGKENFKELHGQTAWDDSYALVIKLATHIHGLGMGFWFTGHVVNTLVDIGEDRNKEVVALTIGRGLWKRLFWRMEMVLPFVARFVTEVIPPEQRRPGGPGTRSARRIVVAVRDPKLAGIAKCKRDLNELILPETNGWDTFLEAYNKAKPTTPSTE